MKIEDDFLDQEKFEMISQAFDFFDDVQNEKVEREEQDAGGGDRGISARMEVGPLLVAHESGFMISDRLLQFFVSPAHQHRFPHQLDEVSFFDRVMWMFKKSASFTSNFANEVMPLRRAPLRRFIPSSPEIKKKMLEQDEIEEKERKEYYTRRGLPLPAPKNKHNLKYFEVDEDDEESLKNWEVLVPVPNDYVKTVERYYGKSWHKEVKWKLDCYT